MEIESSSFMPIVFDAHSIPQIVSFVAKESAVGASATRLENGDTVMLLSIEVVLVVIWGCVYFDSSSNSSISSCNSCLVSGNLMNWSLSRI